MGPLEVEVDGLIAHEARPTTITKVDGKATLARCEVCDGVRSGRRRLHRTIGTTFGGICGCCAEGRSCYDECTDEQFSGE